jgi:hypothetical protein
VILGDFFTKKSGHPVRECLFDVAISLSICHGGGPERSEVVTHNRRLFYLPADQKMTNQTRLLVGAFL